MKTKNFGLIFGALLVLVGALAAPQGAEALGTKACQSIQNTAYVDYKVNNADQTQRSAQNSFFVGNKVNLSVTGTDANGWVTVAPLQTGANLTFTINNLGNAAQKYVLILNHVTGATFTGINADNFAATGVVSIPTATTDVVGPDLSTTVTISATIPDQQDLDVSVWSLKAQTYNVDGTLATEGTVTIPAQNGMAACTADVVFGDTSPSADSAAKDGADSAREAFRVTRVDLAISKSSAALWDPIACAGTVASPGVCGGSPHAIPGAIVEYTITLVNSQTAQATSLKITDALDTTNLDFYADGYGPGLGIAIKDDVTHGTGVFTNYTSDKSGQAGPIYADYNITDANHVITTSGLTVSGGKETVIKYKVIIK